LTYAFLSSQDAADKEKQEKALALVKRAFSECPSYPILIQALFQIKQDKDALVVQDFKLLSSMGGCVLTPGTPVSPMLARPTKSYAMVFDRFEKIMPFTCEYKYDGERAQIHYYQTNDDQKGNLQHKNVDQNGNLQNKIAIFSRNFENSTERFPDVKLILQKIIQTSSQQVTSCILDTEVVAIDKATNQRLPFQILSTRSRKVSDSVYFFFILHI
jgi:DNA ligase-1